MTSVNRFGFARDIPEPVRREVRQRSGFGCVICGAAIIQYHHFAPCYVDARTHSAEGITALCPSCHTKVTSGRVSASALLAAVRSPSSLRTGYSHDGLEIFEPTVILGGLTFKCVPIIIEVAGRALLGFEPPESKGAPIRLNALFCDQRGKPIAEIVANEWRAHAHNWDVETVGLSTTIRGDYRNVSLVFRVEPPSKIVVARIHMHYRGLSLQGAEGSHLSAYLPNGDLWFRATNTASVVGCAKGIVFDAP
jgi:hypothetical protein